MAFHLKVNRVAIATATLISFALPVSAHKTEVSGDIAGTWHVEPNHNPRAGEPAQVWIALTRQGGTIIPLEQCNCQLEIRADSPPSDRAPVLKPSLKSVSAEQYQGIPGAEVIFPKTGQYELKLTGTPKAGANFQPFEFTHTLTVAVGTTPSQSSQAATQSNAAQHNTSQPLSSANESKSQGPVVTAVALLTVGLGALWLVRRRLKWGDR